MKNRFRGGFGVRRRKKRAGKYRAGRQWFKRQYKKRADNLAARRAFKYKGIIKNPG